MIVDKIRKKTQQQQQVYRNNLPAEQDVIEILRQGSDRKFSRKISRRGLAGASLVSDTPRTVLTREQLLQCADSYVSDGIVRIAVNKLWYAIKGDRIKQSVLLNDELYEGLEDAQVKSKEGGIFERLNALDLRKKYLRIHRRVNFDDKITKWGVGIFVFGRAALQNIRKAPIETPDPTDPRGYTWPRYGEPESLLDLNSLRWVDTSVDTTNGDFLGLYYNYGENNRNRELIPAIDLVPAWNDDSNLYDNTRYSGLSLIWPALSVSQSNTVCNDEDIPESFRAVWAKWGHFYTSKKANVKRFSKQFESATLVIHTDPKAKAEVFDMARSLLELTQAREANAKFLLWCIGIPLFIMFEDTANFATANEALQAFKAISIKRYRTWLANMLERYWYDPILADHLNVSVEEVIAEEIRVKAVFEDILFETKDKTASYLKPLADSGYIDKIKLLKELGFDDVIERLDEIEKQAQIERKQHIQEAVEMMIAQGKIPPGMDENGFRQAVKNRQAAAENGTQTVVNVQKPRK